MQSIPYNFFLAMVFLIGITMMIQPHRLTREYMQTLEDIQRAGIDFIGAQCNALPESITDERLLELNHLPHGFNNQGVVFTWLLTDHPVISVDADGNTDYLTFLARHTLGGYETDSSYSFIPDHDNTFFRAANNSYNLFAYAGNDFSCDTP